MPLPPPSPQNEPQKSPPRLGLSGKYSQKPLDYTKQSATGRSKTSSKRAIQETEKATGYLIANKIVERIKKDSRSSPHSERFRNNYKIKNIVDIYIFSLYLVYW